MKILLSIEALGIIVLCCTEVSHTTPRRKEGVAGVSQNVGIQCSIAEDYEDESIDISGSHVFWIINGSVYGLLHVPRNFIVCSEVCELDTLIIPVLQGEMNGYTFQCVGIDYHNSTLYIGETTVLEVTTLPQGALNRNVTLLDDPRRREALELSYPQFSVGAVNTSIGWTYSSLTCHPSVFTIQGFAAIPDQLDTPTLTLTSTSSVLTFPTNITNGPLYWRLLAHDMSGTPCAQDSAVRYYHLDSNGTTPVPISSSSDGVWCVPIPVGRDYSSLEVVWPERRDTVGRLCYCPPFEGEHHLFSRCISTTSCDTDYSITVSNGSVCFAELSPPLTSIPVYFTLLESCADSRCVIRSLQASFIITLDEKSSITTDVSSSSNISEITKDVKNRETTTASMGTTPPKAVPDLLVVAILMVVVFLILLVSFPLAIICYCYKSRKIKRTFTLQQSQHRRGGEVRTERVYETVTNSNLETRVEATEATYSTVIEGNADAGAMETVSQVYDTVTNTRSNGANQSSYSTIPNIQPSSEINGNDPHRVYHIVTNENENGKDGRNEGVSYNVVEGPVGNQLSPSDDAAGACSVYDVVTKKDLQTPADTTEAIYSALDHTKPQTGQDESTYNTLQHARSTRLGHSVSDSHVLVVYDTIDKPKSATAIVPPRPGAVYGSLDVRNSTKYSMVNKKSLSTSAVEGLRKGTTSRLNTCTSDSIEKHGAEDFNTCAAEGVYSARSQKETAIANGPGAAHVMPTLAESPQLMELPQLAESPPVAQSPQLMELPQLVESSPVKDVRQEDQLSGKPHAH